MGVFIEPAAAVLGVTKGQTDHYVSRTQPDGARSGPGDVDLTLYSLRKYMRLATAGNPTVLTVLYAPHDAVLVTTLLGDELREMAPHIASRRASRRFVGYPFLALLGLGTHAFRGNLVAGGLPSYLGCGTAYSW